MPTLSPRIRYLFVALIAVTLLPAPRCSSNNDQVNGMAARSGSSRNYTPVPGSGSTWATGTLPLSAAPVPSEFITQVNLYRAMRGMGPLVYHDGLSLGLQRHSDDMAQYGYFGLFNPTTGIDVPTRLVSSSPRIDFDDTVHFLLRGSVAPTDSRAWDILVRDPFFLEAILDPTATHIGGYRGAHFQVLIGHNVVPSAFTGGPAPPPPPATPPAGGGGGGGSRIITGIRIITIRI